MKRFGRRLKKNGVTLIIIAIFIMIVWAMSHMGNVLAWLIENWLPILIGFVIATFGGIVTDLIMGEDDDSDE